MGLVINFFMILIYVVILNCSYNTVYCITTTKTHFNDSKNVHPYDW